jgi:hypothetical protein
MPAFLNKNSKRASMTITLPLPVVSGILWSALVVGVCVICPVAVELACGAIEGVKRNRQSRHGEQGDAPGRSA